jgi:hypothetical protein
MMGTYCEAVSSETLIIAMRGLGLEREEDVVESAFSRLMSAAYNPSVVVQSAVVTHVRQRAIASAPTSPTWPMDKSQSDFGRRIGSWNAPFPSSSSGSSPMTDLIPSAILESTILNC